MAVEQVDARRQGFKRLGVFASNNPYLTYVNDYDVTDVEIFTNLRQGSVV